jgi:SHS2 domain-containing protein
MAFRYLDDVTAADIAFRATGKTPEELMASAWEATLRVMVALPGDPDGGDEPQIASEAEELVPRVRRTIRLEAAAPDLLLHELLEEQVYLKDAEGLLLLLETCRVEQAQGFWRLEATAAGEEVDIQRHRLGVDVKAVTWHRFEVRRDENGWQATVVLDV